VEHERHYVRKDGSRFVGNGFLAKVGPTEGVEFGMIMRDVTMKRNTEMALAQAQKRESLGILAGVSRTTLITC